MLYFALHRGVIQIGQMFVTPTQHFKHKLTSRKERMHFLLSLVELKVEATRSLKRGKKLAPMRVVQGMLIKLRDCKLEMLIWFVLHDMREFRIFLLLIDLLLNRAHID